MYQANPGLQQRRCQSDEKGNDSEKKTADHMSLHGSVSHSFAFFNFFYVKSKSDKQHQLRNVHGFCKSPRNEKDCDRHDVCHYSHSCTYGILYA